MDTFKGPWKDYLDSGDEYSSYEDYLIDYYGLSRVPLKDLLVDTRRAHVEIRRDPE